MYELSTTLSPVYAPDSMVARCKHSSKDSPRNSFRHMVGNDRVKNKIHSCKKKNWTFGGHLEIQNGRHREKKEIFRILSDISNHIFSGPRNMIMTLFWWFKVILTLYLTYGKNNHEKNVFSKLQQAQFSSLSIFLD